MIGKIAGLGAVFLCSLNSYAAPEGARFCSEILSANEPSDQILTKVLPRQSGISYFLDGDEIRFNSQHVLFQTEGQARGLPPSQTSNITAENTTSGDFAIHSEIRGTTGNDGSVGFAIARLEIDPTAAHIEAVDLAFNKAAVNRGNLFSLEPLVRETGKRYPSLSSLEAKVIKEHITSFYALHFVASSRETRKWSVVIETDVSRRLSQQLGQTITYQADFASGPQLSYVSLPLSAFKPTARGQIRMDLPALASPDYNSQNLQLKSVGFQATRDAVSGGRENLEPIKADLIISKGKIGFGFIPSVSFQEARQMVLRQAELFAEDVSHWMMDTEGREEVIRRNREEAEHIVSMMDRMNARLESFPEIADYRTLTTISTQTEFLTRLFTGGGWYGHFPLPKPSNYIFKGKVEIIEGVWRAIISGNIPREQGDFARIHSENGHALQFAAMLHGSSEDERAALVDFLAPNETFMFRWNILFDTRNGGPTDPASWRKYEHPELTTN